MDSFNFERYALQAIKNYEALVNNTIRALTFDYVRAFREYAEELGKGDPENLTYEEKQEAILRAVLKEEEE